MQMLGNAELRVGLRVILPEEWHEKATTFGKLKSLSYEFEVEEIIKQKSNKETYYLCKPQGKGKSPAIALTESAIKYLIAQEVPDQNIGLSFKEFLPLENTHVLITSVRNPSEVIPGVFRIEPELVELEEKSVICFNSRINYTNGNGFSSVRLYCDGTKKSTWKFLDNPDISCMSEYEQMFQDTMIHKRYLMASCKKLARWLEKEGATEHAAQLLERAKVHDDSKISCEDEMNALSRIIHDKSCLTNASKQLSPIKQDSIKLHWKHNTHHPEHFKTPIDMSKLDIMEMCCDWHARSTQYHTDLLEFVKKRQEDRFHFPEWMFAEIWHYCKVLASEIWYKICTKSVFLLWLGEAHFSFI